MISLIICSRQPDIPQSLKDNIAETIGVEYELVIIDNSENRYSIFQAYNEGVRRARYPYLCFMHDDILYHTQDWGEKVIEHFQDEKVGLIGVVGGHYLPDCPTYWHTTRCISGRLLDSKGKLWDWDRFSKEVKSIDVVSVDGVWFCIAKKMFDKIGFDEITFDSFHAYDIDICLQVWKFNHACKVIKDILISHKSWGNYPNAYYNAMQKCYDKWKSFLPFIKGIELDEADIEDRKYFANKEFEYLGEYWRLNTELSSCHSSHAYRLGKFILKPFSLLKRILKQ